MIRRMLRDQRGISLLEMVVAVGISGLLAGGLGSIGFDLLRHSEVNKAHVTAASNIEGAARLVAQDGQSAQGTDLVVGAAGVNTVTLSWIDPTNGDSYVVVYSLSGDTLMRTKSVNSVVQTVTAAARHINSVSFSQPAGQDRLVKLNVTSSGGSGRVNETKEYYVALRALD